ncbi:MAG: UbiA family prenyltransferase [Planctomycetes bacterium]|nr:UbiA family prenyltransferase [Planctomycetota bacterium]
MKFLTTQLRLVRLPNIFTAISNIWAGSVIAASGTPNWLNVLVGSIASAALYAGGTTLNDYCNREEDRRNRPNRPIPSGAISPQLVLVLAVIRLTVGAGLGFIISTDAGVISCAIAVSAVLYNRLKSRTGAAIFLMALCRGLNWLLGLLSGAKTINPCNPWLLLPAGIFLYIASLTAVSRWEEKIPSMKQIVKLGIVAIPLIDAAIVLSFGYYWQGLAIAALVIPAIILGKIFEMT